MIKEDAVIKPAVTSPHLGVDHHVHPRAIGDPSGSRPLPVSHAAVLLLYSMRDSGEMFEGQRQRINRPSNVSFAFRALYFGTGLLKLLPS